MADQSPGQFPATRWSLLLDAQDDDPAALAEICKAYWFPLYCFARRLRPNKEAAEDLTQSFFQHLLSKDGLQKVRSERGKLRTFLMAALQNHARDEHKKESRLKRGGHIEHFSMDVDSAEQELDLHSGNTESPEIAFDRAWARQVMITVVDSLQAAYAQAGKAELFAELRPQLESELQQRPYAEIAETLGMSEPAVRLASFKLRKRFKKALAEAIADTVPSTEDVAEELAYLQRVFSD